QSDLDGRVELRHLLRLGQGDRFGGAVELRPVDLLVGLAVGLAALHNWSPMVRRSWSAGPRQALPHVSAERPAAARLKSPEIVRRSAVDLDAHRAGSPGDDLLGGL